MNKDMQRQTISAPIHCSLFFLCTAQKSTYIKQQAPSVASMKDEQAQKRAEDRHRNTSSTVSIWVVDRKTDVKHTTLQQVTGTK